MHINYLPKVKKFITGLDDTLAYRVVSSIDFLERYGHKLEMPISKPLGQGLFELRITGNNHIRILYCFHKDAVYLLHAIMKKRQAIPREDIHVARKIMKQIVQI